MLRLELIGPAYAPRVATINVNAFADFPARRAALPNTTSKEVLEFLTGRAEAQMKNDRNTFYVGAFEGAELIAFARWRLEDDIEHSRPEQPAVWAPGANEAVKGYFFGGIALAEREIMGHKTYWRKDYSLLADRYFETNVLREDLDLLACDPIHGRKGAGAALVRWGTDQADQSGMETFLDATPVGEPLYRRLGFRERKVNVFDYRLFGVDLFYQSKSMVREPLMC